MDMTLNIKRVGQVRGTVGWLAQNLEAGNLYLSEGHDAETGYHGLWLKGAALPTSQLLAMYNELNLTPAEWAESLRYRPVTEGYYNTNCIGVTDACWRTLMTIAQQWCDLCNAALDQEQPLTLQIVRVAAAEEDSNHE
jgi:hypothetical protein